MVTILRCDRDEELLLRKASADPDMLAEGWVTTRPVDGWKARDAALIITGFATQPEITHVGLIRKGPWRGTLHRELSVTKVRPLPDPCRLDELVQGMYLPREYFDLLLNDPRSPVRGSRGGVRFGYRTVPRYLDNTTFSSLVQDGWIGSTGKATEIVERQIEASHAGSREIVFAALIGENTPRAQRARRQHSRAKRR